METIKPEDVKTVDVTPVEPVVEAVKVEATVATPAVAPTPEEIMAKIAAAGASGDLAEVIRLGNQLKKHQTEILKAEADKLKAEADVMAGDRAKLAEAILKAVKGVVNTAELEKLKATGFTYKLPYLDANGVMTSASVALSVPTIKVKSTGGGGGGGSTGALKAQTGLSRHELVEQHASDAEKAEIAKAESEATTRPDSARYTAEKPVIKRILADHPELIKH